LPTTTIRLSALAIGARSNEPEGGYRANPNCGASPLEGLVTKLWHVNDDLPPIVQVQEVGSGFLAQAMALAAWAVDFDSHVSLSRSCDLRP
jgi:hypothetical protein